MSFVPPKMQTELLSSGNDRIRFPVNKLMENFKKKLLKQCKLHKVLMIIHPLNAQRSENTQVRYTRVGTWKDAFQVSERIGKDLVKKSNCVVWKNKASQELVEKENCRVGVINWDDKQQRRRSLTCWDRKEIIFSQKNNFEYYFI